MSNDVDNHFKESQMLLSVIILPHVGRQEGTTQSNKIKGTNIVCSVQSVSPSSFRLLCHTFILSKSVGNVFSWSLFQVSLLVIIPK